MIADQNKEPEPLASPDSARGFVAWFCKLVWGNGFTRSDDDDGLGHAITLLGILMAWQLALLAYVQTEPTPEPRVVTVYIVVSMLPLLGIFWLCAVPSLKLYHRRISWRLGLAAMLLVIGVAASYVSSMLPGQQFRTGTYINTGEELLAVSFARDAEPVESMTWNAALSLRASRYWAVEEVLCYRDAKHTDPVEVRYDSGTAPTRSGGFSGNRGHKYYFRVDLKKVGDGEPDFKFSMEDLAFRLEPAT